METTLEPKTTTAAPTTSLHGIPIMVEILPEDVEKAGRYSDGRNCLLATALKRMGYNDVVCYASTAEIGGHNYWMHGGISSDLQWDSDLEMYDPRVVGHQVVFYPADK